HARGVCCEALFSPSQAAAQLTAAPHFQGPAVAAVVRFSNSSTRPDAADYSLEVAGMAVKFLLEGGREPDIVANNFPVFFVRAPPRARLPPSGLAAATAARPGRIQAFDPACCTIRPHR